MSHFFVNNFGTLRLLQILKTFSGVFCEDPPVPDSLSDLKIVPNSTHALNLRNRIPLNGTVNYECNEPGRLATDYNATTFDNVVTCVNLTDGSYNKFSWPTCKRSKSFYFYLSTELLSDLGPIL